MIRQLVLHTDPVLRKKCEEVPFNNTDISQDVLDTFNTDTMLGLSAPQIGLPYRCSVCNFSTGKEVVINPKIEPIGDERIVSVERCLSFPNVVCKVRRFSQIKVEYFDGKWNKCEKILKGLDACVMQHEYDHLDGFTMMDKAFSKTYKKVGRR